MFVSSAVGRTEFPENQRIQRASIFAELKNRYFDILIPSGDDTAVRLNQALRARDTLPLVDFQCTHLVFKYCAVLVASLESLPTFRFDEFQRHHQQHRRQEAHSFLNLPDGRNPEFERL